jgi:hypothetical protein
VYVFWFLCQKSDGCSYVGLFYFWVLYSVPLIFMSVFVPVPCCFYYYVCVV